MLPLAFTDCLGGSLGVYDGIGAVRLRPCVFFFAAFIASGRLASVQGGFPVTTHEEQWAVEHEV